MLSACNRTLLHGLSALSQNIGSRYCTFDGGVPDNKEQSSPR